MFVKILLCTSTGGKRYTDQTGPGLPYYNVNFDFQHDKI